MSRTLKSSLFDILKIQSNDQNNSDISNDDVGYIIKTPSKDQLIKMLKMEETIRFSPEYITKCDEVADEVNGWLRISAEVQKQVAENFGFKSQIENDIAVNHMRRAQHLYPDEPLFKTISVYVRQNLATKGKYQISDIVPNIQLHQNNNSNDSVNLYEILDPYKKNVLIASSHT
jgi:hypothetical protein